MEEYVFEGCVIIDGHRFEQFPECLIHTQAKSIEQARNNIIWVFRQRYNLTKKLWIDVHIEGTLCKTKDYAEAKRRQKEKERERAFATVKEMKRTFEEVKDPINGAEQISFPINELIKK